MLTDEKNQKPKFDVLGRSEVMREGDQWKRNYEPETAWKTISAAGMFAHCIGCQVAGRFSEGATVRRRTRVFEKAKDNPLYRTVGRSETVEHGDQWMKDGHWMTISAFGAYSRVVGRQVAQCFGENTAVRRRVSDTPLADSIKAESYDDEREYTTLHRWDTVMEGDVFKRDGGGPWLKIGPRAKGGFYPGMIGLTVANAGLLFEKGLIMKRKRVLCGCGHHTVVPGRDPNIQHTQFLVKTGRETFNSSWFREPEPPESPYQDQYGEEFELTDEQLRSFAEKGKSNE